MADQELLSLILNGREERNLEYKGPISWASTETRGKLTKTVLALSNIQDGGAIVVGVEQTGETFNAVGLAPDDRDSFRQDDVSAFVNEYADPFAQLSVAHVAHEGRSFVVIQVEQFLEIPVVCRKNGPGGLRGGAIYTRPRRKHETAEVPSQVEMRELLEVAIHKGIRRLQGRLTFDASVVTPEERSRQRFDQEIADL